MLPSKAEPAFHGADQRLAGAPEDAAVRLVVMPLYHIAELIVGMALPILAGETMVLVERFDPQAG